MCLKPINARACRGLKNRKKGVNGDFFLLWVVNELKNICCVDSARIGDAFAGIICSPRGHTNNDVGAAN